MRNPNQNHTENLNKSMKRLGDGLGDEAELVQFLLNDLGQNDEIAIREKIHQQASDYIREIRAQKPSAIMDVFLKEYGLSTKEGVALMCLAEALLRVPDIATIDALIRDKITPHDWSKHLGQSSSILVNASTWGLLLTGQVLEDEGQIPFLLHKMTKRMGEPIIRKAVAGAMKELGSQFVLGESLGKAIQNGKAQRAKSYRYSYDMLGEAACTMKDAERYMHSYEQAILEIAKHAKHSNIRDNPSISVKLSALHPRYEYKQKPIMFNDLSARLLKLVRMAAKANIGLNIDAEEASRLEFSQALISEMLKDKETKAWQGFGIVVQAYSKRALPFIDFLYERAKIENRKIMVRLVKGAYWDSEIKWAQQLGLSNYPVFTMKSHTDLSYLACAKRLLSYQDWIYPQFATHNAHSMSAVIEFAKQASVHIDQFEFQRLHGMGETLHDLIMKKTGIACRIYAPVGAHRDLLAYLVRRLLENGANSSFVNQIMDKSVSPEKVAQDPIVNIFKQGGRANPNIPLPAHIFKDRLNSRGWDEQSETQIEIITTSMEAARTKTLYGVKPSASSIPVINPADLKCIGHYQPALFEDIDQAIDFAKKDHGLWLERDEKARSAILVKVAELFEANQGLFYDLLIKEAGKTLADAIGEVREAVDFLRYYAASPQKLDLPDLEKVKAGYVICISPWNFPLAIFSGQIAAALVAGRRVIAKPAEQTSLIAIEAVRLFHQAGVGTEILQILLGDGAKIGAKLLSDANIGGVCFTGSVQVATLINRNLSKTAPNAFLIAETGGLNAMIVDSTALIEQAVKAIVKSAFQSAGQRCSALRMLYLQKDIAEETLIMLKGAMDCLLVQNPASLISDLGPVIDLEAFQHIQEYVSQNKQQAKVLHQINVPKLGYFISPTLIEVSGIEALGQEIFGPILHIATYKAKDLEKIIHAINHTGYGLTHCLMSRIDHRVQIIADKVKAGNIYINRDQIGAVVGVQPFGGEGLSGTGPKAGGPLYLHKFKPKTVLTPNQPLSVKDSIPEINQAKLTKAMKALIPLQASWQDEPNKALILRQLLRGNYKESMLAALELDTGPIDLTGITGESNQYRLVAKGIIIALGPDETSMMDQILQALSMGNGVIAYAPFADKLIKTFQSLEKLPLIALQPIMIPFNADSAWRGFDEMVLDGIAYCHYEGVNDKLYQLLRQRIAQRDGAIIPLISGLYEPEAYIVERSLSIDTSAAGGNATLLNQEEA